MENQYQKFVTISYLAFAALVAFLTFSFLMWVSNTFDLESKVKSVEYIIRFGTVALGFAIFFVMYKMPTVNNFMLEVADELLSKVSWPTPKETWAGTLVVIIAVTIAGIVLGFFDWIWSLILKSLLS